MGTKIYANAAERQKAFRQRRLANMTATNGLVDAFIAALDRGRCHRFVKGLPEEPQARLEAIVAKLDNRALVIFPARGE